MIARQDRTPSLTDSRNLSEDYGHVDLRNAYMRVWSDLGVRRQHAWGFWDYLDMSQAGRCFFNDFSRTAQQSSRCASALYFFRKNRTRFV